MPYKTKPNLISIYPFFISSDLYVIWKIKYSILARPPPPPHPKKKNIFQAYIIHKIVLDCSVTIKG